MRQKDKHRNNHIALQVCPASGPCLIQLCTAPKLSYPLSSFISCNEGITDFGKECICMCLECSLEEPAPRVGIRVHMGFVGREDSR